MLVGTVVAFRATDLVRLRVVDDRPGWLVVLPSFSRRSATEPAVAYALTYAAPASSPSPSRPPCARRGAGSERGPRGIPRAGAVPPHVGGPLILALLTLAGLPPAILGSGRQVVAIRPLLAGRAVHCGAGRDRGRARHRGVCPLDCGAAGRTRSTGTTAASGNNAGTGWRCRWGPGALAVLSLGTALLVVASVVPQVLYGLLS